MHVYVTGASSGIGEAIAREYARRGARLTLVARRRKLLDALAAELGGEVRVVEQDLSDVENVCAPIAAAEEANGPIDVLVNNAGIQIVGATTKSDWAKGEALLRLNVFVPMRLTLHVLPGMIARGHGTIVDISSMAALGPTPGMFFYNASKGALAAASEGLRGELRGTGVHVVTVYPGPVHSAMESAAREALVSNRASRMAPTGEAHVLARLVADAVEKKRPRVIYPRVYALSRHFPNMSRWMIDAFTPKPR